MIDLMCYRIDKFIHVLINLVNLVSFSFEPIETSKNDRSPIEPKQDEKVNGSKLDGSVRSKRKGE